MTSIDFFNYVFTNAQLDAGVEQYAYRKFFARVRFALDWCDLPKSKVIDPVTRRPVEIVSLTDEHIALVLRKEPAQVRKHANALLRQMPVAAPKAQNKTARHRSDWGIGDVIVGALVFDAVFGGGTDCGAGE